MHKQINIALLGFGTVVSERGEVELTTALEQVRGKYGLMGVQLDGEMFDMGIPQAYRNCITNFVK